MDSSVRLALPFIAAGQAQKHVTHNDALVRLDLLVLLVIAARDLGLPPSSAAEGTVYAVPDGATGAWAGREGQLAAWLDGGWVYLPPRDGWRAFVLAEDLCIVHRDGAWLREDGLAREVGPLDRLGLGMTADGGTPFAARLNAALWTARPAAEAGSGDLRLLLDKEAAANTASLVFQTGYSGRAEIGLAGDDNLHLKVSADGTGWITALTVDRGSGQIALQAGAAATPALAFAGDADTGLFSPGADTVAFATAGSERLRIAGSGSVGIGSSAVGGYGVRVGRSLTGATNTIGVGVTGTIQSDSTGIVSGFLSSPTTAAASFTTASIRHFHAVQGSLGSGSAVTAQFGFLAANTLVGATTNYGFYSDLSSGTGRWNVYANGTAANHFNGAVAIGTTATAEKLTVAGNIAPATDNAHSLGTAALRASVVYAATGVINTSDAREKCEIEPCELGLAFIRSLTPRSYRWRVGGCEAPQISPPLRTDAEGHASATDPAPPAVPRPGRRRHHGLLAQEVREALAGLGISDFAGYVLADPADPQSRQGLRYDQFLAPLIKAVQELDARLARIEAAAPTG